MIEIRHHAEESKTTVLLDEEIVDLMKRSGMSGITLGLESFDENVLTSTGKGTTVANNVRAINLLKAAGIISIGHIVLGLPEETWESAETTTEQVIRSNPDYPLAYRWLAAALGQLGRTAEAKEALEKAIASGPASFDLYVRRVPWHRPEDHAHMLEGLHKAGWREE